MARDSLAKVFGASEVDAMDPQLAILNGTAMSDIHPDGTVAPKFHDRLVWAFVERAPCTSDKGLGAIAPIMGPPTADGPPARYPVYEDGTVCVGVLIADAGTGEYLLGSSETDDAESTGAHPTDSSLRAPLPSP